MLSSIDVQEWLSANHPKTCDGASISKPTRLGLGWTKSSGETAEYSHGDFSGLPALQIPTVLPVDLNKGIEKFVPKRRDANGSKSPGVEFLINEAFVARASLSSCDILTFRNNLNKVLGTVYDLKYPWTVDATSLVVDGSKNGSDAETKKPTMFLDIVHDDELSSLRSGDPSIPYIAWGYNFEAICTGAPYADANSEYGMLVNFKLDGKRKNSKGANPKFSVYLGAEIDAYDPAELPSEHDVQSIPPISSLREIKTFTRPENDSHWWTTYNLRHPKWWLQSYLAGVPALVLGARDKQGIVHEIHTVKTSDLPRMSWENGCKWSPQQALAFGADVLSWMMEICESEECINKHVRFEYHISSRKISACILQGGDLPGRVTAAIEEQQQQQREVQSA
jgi:RAT1-interacting protein